MAKLKLTAKRLRELVSYDPETGILTWALAPSKSVLAGWIVGHRMAHGYWQAQIDYQMYYVHRLIWLYVTGQWPTHQIDHIDGDPGNNRFENLRDVTHSGNTQNLKGPYRTNRSGFLGVVIERGKKKPFRAVIKINGMTRHIGHFYTAEEAHEAYLAAKRILHPFGTL